MLPHLDAIISSDSPLLQHLLTSRWPALHLSHFDFYRPQRSWGKVIFSEVCVKNSVHKGGHVWQGGPCMVGACMAGGMYSGGMHGRGHAWWGACVAGVACMPHMPPLDTMRYGQSMCRQYASYWNAFLFYLYMCKHWWDLNPWLSVWYNVNSNCLSLTDSGLPVFNKIWHKIMCIRNVIWTTCQYLNIF